VHGLPRWHQCVKNPLANAGDLRDVGSIPGSGRSPGGGHAEGTRLGDALFHRSYITH